QFFGNGALFVAPACGLLIVVSAWRWRGTAGLIAAAAPGFLWIALLAVNYALVLRPAQMNAFLQSYWQTAFPTRAAGTFGVIRWFAERLGPFAVKPGGTHAGLLLWFAAAVGFATAGGKRRLLAIAFALVPLSAFALSTAHILPFFERLVLWV